jgi:hypothetical protein
MSKLATRKRDDCGEWLAVGEGGYGAISGMRLVCEYFGENVVIYDTIA